MQMNHGIWNGHHKDTVQAKSLLQAEDDKSAKEHLQRAELQEVEDLPAPEPFPVRSRQGRKGVSPLKFRVFGRQPNGGAHQSEEESIDPQMPQEAPGVETKRGGFHPQDQSGDEKRHNPKKSQRCQGPATLPPELDLLKSSSSAPYEFGAFPETRSADELDRHQREGRDQKGEGRALLQGLQIIEQTGHESGHPVLDPSLDLVESDVF